jgi:hypothetical protein
MGAVGKVSYRFPWSCWRIGCISLRHRRSAREAGGAPALGEPPQDPDHPGRSLARLGEAGPHRLPHLLPGGPAWAERLPRRQYAGHRFQVCVNDQFDPFSAPTENGYTRAQLRSWLECAELKEIQMLPNWGWLGSGRNPRRAAPADGRPATPDRAQG